MKLPIQQLQAALIRLSKREKLILYLSAFFISLTLIDRLVIDPISSKIKSLDDEIAKKEQAIVQAGRIVSQKDKIESAKAAYGSFLAESGSGEEMALLLKEIEAMANKSSVYLLDLKPAGLKEVDGLKKYLIALNCEAQMEQLVDFMYAIESSPRLLTIEKYNISQKARDSSIARCSISISKLSLP